MLGSGSWTSCFFLGQAFVLKFNVLILLYFVFTQRQYETMHLSFFALDPCCSEEKYFLIWTEIWTLLYEEKKQQNKTKKKLCVNSSMNLITAVCAQIEWEEHSWPAGQTEATFLVELVSYCHSIHVLTQNKVKGKEMGKKHTRSKEKYSSMDIFRMPDL